MQGLQILKAVLLNFNTKFEFTLRDDSMINVRRMKIASGMHYDLKFSSVQFSHSVVSDFLQPHELQHARPPCPAPTPGVH